jgi:hypothetical protein
VTEAAALLGALGAVLALVGRPRVGLAAGLVALGLAELALGWRLVPGGLDAKLASTEGLLALVVGVPALAALAAVFVRYPALVPPVVVAAAPFRLPFEFGSENRLFIGLADSGRLGRLLPLYGVVAAAGLALAWRSLRGAEIRPLPWPIAVPTALFAALAIASVLWAYEPAAAGDRLAFFLVPFTALFAVVARSPFRPWLPRVLAIEAALLACLFAAVGIVEAIVEDLLFYDPKVAVSNSFTSYFRVTSLFDDPSIYGRHVVLGIVVLVVALWLGRIGFWLGAALVTFLWVGLFFSYSQSSMVALAAGVLVTSFLVADRRVRRALGATAVALVLVGGVFLALLLRSESADRVTSDRWTLVTDTATVVANHPVLGVGVAGQPQATRDEVYGRGSPSAHVSHTAPLTVAAEQGVLGVLAYVAFLAGAVWTLLVVRRADEALGLGLIAAFVVLFVHSLTYGLFFEDPFSWCVLALAAGFAAGARAPLPALPFRRLATASRAR